MPVGWTPIFFQAQTSLIFTTTLRVFLHLLTPLFFLLDLSLSVTASTLNPALSKVPRTEADYVRLPKGAPGEKKLFTAHACQMW